MNSANADSARATDPASRRWTGKTRGGLFGNWFFVVLVRYLGLMSAYLFLIPVSFYYVFFAPKARRASMDYLARIGCASGSLPARLWWCWRHFYSFGQALIDRVVVIGGAGGKFHIEFEGEDYLRDALAEGKGLVILGAHCGNWEIAAHLLDRLDAPVRIVAYEGEAAHIDRFFQDVFKDRNFSVIRVDGSVETSFAILGALAKGEIVAMHADRSLNEESTVSVPFLGADAVFPKGPFVVAAVSGAPMVHAFAMRERPYHYTFTAYPPERLEFGERARRAEDLAEWAGRFVSHLETQLKKHPLQWHNFYKFWETGSQLEKAAA